MTRMQRKNWRRKMITRYLAHMYAYPIQVSQALDTHMLVGAEVVRSIVDHSIRDSDRLQKNCDQFFLVSLQEPERQDPATCSKDPVWKLQDATFEVVVTATNKPTAASYVQYVHR